MASKPLFKKTYKREVATALLTLLGYVVVIGNVEVLEVIVWPFMVFAGAAFGMDWAGKQGNELISRNNTRDVSVELQPSRDSLDYTDRWWS